MHRNKNHLRRDGSPRNLVKMFIGAVAVLPLLAITTASYGTTVTLNATADTWLAYTSKSGWSTTPRGDDTTVNSHSGSTNTGTSQTTTNTRTLGALEFDLSKLPAGATITDAHVQLFMDTTSGFGAKNSGTGIDRARFIQLSANSISRGTAGTNSGLSFGPADINPSTLTYLTTTGTVGYSDNPTTGSSFQATDFLSDTFGTYNYATTTVNANDYTASSGPSANDLAYIQGVYNDSWQKLGILLDPQSSATGSTQDAHDWSSDRDTNFPAFVNNVTGYVGPQLVVSYTLAPEPSSLVLLAGSMLLLPRRKTRSTEKPVSASMMFRRQSKQSIFPAH